MTHPEQPSEQGADPRRSYALDKRDAYVRPGHDFGDEPSMVSGEDLRWTCKTCRCFVWVRAFGEPYGDATRSGCVSETGKGRVDCRQCGGYWPWPGSFSSEQEARVWSGHTCGYRWVEVTVIKQPVTSPPQATTDRAGSEESTCLRCGSTGPARWCSWCEAPVLLAATDSEEPS